MREESRCNAPALHDANKTAFTVRLNIQTHTRWHTWIHTQKWIKTGRHTVQLCQMHNKLDIMSELYSCRKAIQRGFHLHAGLYPSNTFQKEQFACCGGPFVTGNETMQTLILIWNNTAVVERRPCFVHLLKTFISWSQTKHWKNNFIKTHSLFPSLRLLYSTAILLLYV